MTFDDLATLFRFAVDDTDANDPLWTDTEIYSYADGAQKEFARRTDYFSDASTTAIVDIVINKVDLTANPVVINDTHKLFALDPRVTKIRNARLVSTGQKIIPKKYDDIGSSEFNGDDYGSSSFDWETSLGEPRFLVTDMERGKVRVVPIHTSNVANPSADDLLDTIRLHVYRLPLDDITETYQGLEVVEEDYQRGLLFYMKYMAYGKNDIDTYDERLQATALLNHETFIQGAKADLRRLRFSSTTGVVRYGGL
jgi:hypothetical protein